MKIGLVGLPRSGKTTVFNALTGLSAETGASGRGKTNLGTVKVPDPRVDALAGRTSVIVSHRLTAVREADWILVLDGGRVVEQGTHETLAARGGRYWELLRRQQLEEELEDVRSGPAETPA